MRIYLDTCSLQRPLDDKSQLRIRLEAEAIMIVLDLVKIGQLQLVSSDTLVFEISRNPYPARQDFGLETIAGASTYVLLSREVKERAQELSQKGIDTLDSLHLASAESGKAEFFCTCDDVFLNKARREVMKGTKVVSPLELAEEIEKWQSRQGR
ncbi:MAG TPA: PIN domain-containing protein [Thermoanaerobaculia bacterium]